MKIIKYILGTFFILITITELSKGLIGVSFIFLCLGLLILPPISDYLKENYKFWKSRGVRYVTYIVLFFSISIFMPKEFLTNSATSNEKINATIHKQKKEHLKKNQEKKKVKQASKENNFEFQTCDYGGGKFKIIPDFIAGTLYTDLQNKGFTVDKNIQLEGTDIYCQLSTQEVKYNVVITGCTPTKIISIEGSTIDYSGDNLQSVKAFFGFLATIPYENSDPDKARKWIEKNINIDGATTTFGGVTFEIHFKSKFSKSFSMRIE